MPISENAEIRCSKILVFMFFSNPLPTMKWDQES